MTLFIDSLDQGGAQRQLTMLAALLTCRGYDVDVLTYGPADFFDSSLAAAGVPIRRLPSSRKLRRALNVRQAIRDRNPDVVVAYLAGPGLYAELARLPARQFGLIVTEFVVPDGAVGSLDRLRLAAHRLADVVVTETEHVRRLVTEAVPGLADRVVVIRNGVDLQEFRPANREEASGATWGSTNRTRVLVAAAYTHQKNPFGMLAAMEHVRQIAPDADIELDWYGSTEIHGRFHAVHGELRRAVRNRGLDDVFRLHGPTHGCASLYRKAALVCLPSFWEGCSNVICEAAASGVPLVVSDVCDNREFVVEGVTGFLVDPREPASIGDAILRFHGLSEAAKREMGRRARLQAERLFDPRRFVESYAALMTRVAFA